MKKKKQNHRDNLLYQTFVVIDFKKRLIGKFNAKQLADEFKCNFASLTTYIRKKARFNLLYYIYREKDYNKMMEEQALLDAQ